MFRSIAIALIVAAFAGSAAAQTGLGIEAGFLQPIGDFADVADISPAFGVRWEIQDVNALGQVATMSFLVRSMYGILQTDADFEDSLRLLGGTPDDGSLLELGVAARGHSKASPLFVGIGAHYANVDAPGDGESTNAFGAFGGLGVRLGTATLIVDLEARMCILIPEEGDNLSYAAYTASLGLPF